MEELTVMALDGVCSRPDRRGEGSGRAMVEDVFDRLDRGDPLGPGY